VVPLTVGEMIAAHRQGVTDITLSGPQESEISDATVKNFAARYAISTRDLHIYAATSLGLGTTLAAVFGFIALGDSFLPDDWYSNVTNFIGALPILLMVLLALLTLCAGTFITYLRLLFKYYDFTLTRQDQQLITQQGLIQKNTVTQPVNRIQAVVFRQNIIRQWFNLTTVETLAASQLDDTSQEADLVALPVAPSQHIWRVMQPFITWIPFIQPVLTPLPPQRDWLFIRNCLLLWLLPVIAVIYFFPQFSWWPLLLLVIAIFQGRYVSRHTKWAQRDDNLILATGSRFTSAVYLIPGRNIQSFTYNQSLFMQHRQLAHITVNVRRGNSVEAIELRYLPEDEAHNLYNWFKNRQQTAL
jgi:putative membrane protein